MEEKELLSEIHYNYKKDKRSTELFKSIAKVKKEINFLYEQLKEMAKNDYNL